MKSAGFDRARNFFSAYFHEDWAEEAGTPEAVITGYLAEGWSFEEMRQLAIEIESLGELYIEDADLEEALFSELGCYYQPSADGVAAHTWLSALSRTLTVKGEL
jgi:hypothetical protein